MFCFSSEAADTAHVREGVTSAVGVDRLLWSLFIFLPTPYEPGKIFIATLQSNYFFFFASEKKVVLKTRGKSAAKFFRAG